MPVYQYACTACGEQLEVRQSFTDDALTECPVCAGRLRKVLSAVGVVFKGSGFYRTDSRKAQSASTSNGSTGESNGSSPAKESTPAKETGDKKSASTSPESKPANAPKPAGSNGSGPSSGSTTTPAAAR